LNAGQSLNKVSKLTPGSKLILQVVLKYNRENTPNEGSSMRSELRVF